MSSHSAAAAADTADDDISASVGSVAVEAVTPQNHDEAKEEDEDAGGAVNSEEKDDRAAAAAKSAELRASARDSDSLSLQNPRSDSADAEPHPPRDAFHSVSLAAAEAVAPPASAAAAETTLCGLSLRTLLCAFLLSLAVSDFVLGISSVTSPQCDLSVYVIGCGVVSAGLFAIVAFRERIAFMQRSLTLRRVAIAGAAFVCAFSLSMSGSSISQLAEGGCPTRLSVRQLALANIILIYSTALGMTVAGFLQAPRFKALSKRVGQVSLVLLCLAGFIACTANLASSGSAGSLPRYHWGLGERAARCPLTCNEALAAANAPPIPPRETICFSADGEPVEAAFCDPAEKPLKTSWLFAPCIDIVCSGDFTGHWALSHEESLAPINDRCVNRPAILEGGPFQQLGCWNEAPSTNQNGAAGGERNEGPSNVDPLLPVNAWVSWEHCPTARPSGWVPTNPEYDTATRFSDWRDPLPPMCPQQCSQLKASAVVYAVLFGLVALGLTGALCAGKRRPAVVTLDEHLQQQRIAHATEAKEAEMELAPSDSSAVDVMPSAGDAVSSSAPSPPQAPSRRALYHLSELCTALWQLTVNGSRAVLPWWRHFLLLCACVLVAAATVLAFANMLLLVNSNCRDFIVSASTAAAVCFVCAAVMANVVVVHRNSLKQAELNPFEQIGLLRELDEEDEELDQAAAAHEAPAPSAA